MEAQFRGKAPAYGPVVTNSKAAGKRSLEWDLNDWKWDGDLLVASSLNPVSADGISRQLLPVRTETPFSSAASFHGSSLFADGTNFSQENGKDGLERRIVIMGGDEANEEAVALNLKLGGKSYPLMDDEADKSEGRSVKKTKVAGNTNIPACQVQSCGADLTNAKDYHRRHKVCEMHSKATQAVVGNIMQRFCQQCSRFHVLQEFDEGKRSCRRRLAGHNRRRRKTHPETAVNAELLNANESNESHDQDLLSQLLRNLQGQTNGTSIPWLAPGSQAQGAPNVGTPSLSPEKDSSRDYQYCGAVQSNEAQHELSTHEPPREMLQNPSEVLGRVVATCAMDPARQNVQEETLQRKSLNNIDLNNVYSQHCLNDEEIPHSSVGVPFWVQKDSHKSSPPQASRNSGSTSTHSLSSSSGSGFLSRTDRIIFKLFGKDPGDLPHLLRTQLLEWLSQSPTDIEGYIRPGCTVLTIYLRLNKTSWEEVEDSGVSGSFFPFIVADPDVCSEICTLERIIESAESCEEESEGQESANIELRIKAVEFIQEMGWLLHRSSSNIRLHHVEGFGECFPFERFKWLLDFSMDHAWPAVLKKLLDLLLNGVVDSGAYPCAENALLEMGLLHEAVRKNSRCLVESLLSYVPQKQSEYGLVGSYFFRPDVVGPAGLTPLHIAASSSGSEGVLDALLEDPTMTGIEAWKTVGDSTGLTPNDYASLRGHYSYINSVKEKEKKKKKMANEEDNGQVTVDIPAAVSDDSRAHTKHLHILKSAQVNHSFQTEKLKTTSSGWQCNACERKLRYGNARAGSAFAYRPAMLSMVAVAAVCVCVALLFKTLPVVYLSKPFRWETLKYGPMRIIRYNVTVDDMPQLVKRILMGKCFSRWSTCVLFAENGWISSSSSRSAEYISCGDEGATSSDKFTEVRFKIFLSTSVMDHPWGKASPELLLLVSSIECDLTKLPLSHRVRAKRDDCMDLSFFV
ncbi:hypothetical protein V2J09_008931 [Rumex salicifolius]